jgi:hypothetical protein
VETLDGNGEYRILRRLGSGGMGVVHEVEDATGRRMAAKTLHWPEGEEIYRLKQEFRALAGIVHDNLVTLYELKTHGRQCFFTMELVDGRTFVQHVRRGVERRREAGEADPQLNPVELDALRSLTGQLVDGIDALHRTGHLHRDIKPSNVLVNREGRLKILDFGVVTLLTPRARDLAGLSKVVGTIAYMAPEQGWGTALSPASDWYALGVVLYEAISGKKPFQGQLIDVLAAKDARDLVPLRQVAPEVPPELEQLVWALLDPDPSRRPDAIGIRAALGVSRSPDLAAAPTFGEPIFVGRAEPLARLHEAFGAVRRDGAGLVQLSGAAGMGKSALVEHFLDELRQAGTAFSFTSRCHPAEHVPFQALDALIDGISRHLLQMSPLLRTRTVPPSAPGLVRLFPVLTGVPDIPWHSDEHRHGGPTEQRRRAFQALRELLGALGRDRPIVLWIDDLQWGDLDSAFALRELIRPPDAPPVLIVLSYRTEDRAEGALIGALQPDAPGMPEAPQVRIELGRLSNDEARVLVDRLLSDEGEAPVPISTLVAEGAGSPLLTAELTRSFRARAGGPPPSLQDLLRARVAALPAPARRLLEVVVVAGRPLDAAAATAAARVGDQAPRVTAQLFSAHLLRRVISGGQARLDLFQNAVREAVLASLDTPALQALHAELARSLVTLEGADPRHLIGHYLESGQTELAQAQAEVAAEQAMSTFAFHLAAEQFQLVLRLLPEGAARWHFLRRRAEALAASGLGGEAAVAFSEAARDLSRQAPNDPRRAELQRQAAEHWLRSGHLEEGLRTLESVLQGMDLSLPGNPTAALAALVLQRLRLRFRGLGYRERRAEDLEPATLQRVDACWATAVGLCWVDSVRSAVFQCRYTQLALDCGEPTRVARALGTEAAFISSEGGAPNRRRAAEALEAARRITAATADPAEAAITLICTSASTFFSARFREARDSAAAAEALLRAHRPGMTWELTNAHIFGMWSTAYLGELSHMRQRLPALLEEARERGNMLGAASLSTGLPNLAWLALDQPGQARRQADDAISLWSGESGFHTQHYMHLIARVHLDLYLGQPEAAWDRLSQAWPRMKNAQMLRLQMVRIEATHLRARVALTRLDAGTVRGTEAETLRKAIQRDARGLAAEDLPWGPNLSLSIQGALSFLSGRADEGLRLLDSAVRAFDEADMALHAAAARITLDHLGQPNPVGRAWMAREGVIDPLRLSRVLVPGWTGANPHR